MIHRDTVMSESLPTASNPAGAQVDGGRLDRLHIKVKCLHIAMRTNIDLDDDLMRLAMRSSEATTKRGVVEEALRLLIQTRTQGSIRRLRGKVVWQGDLAASRLQRSGK